MTKQIVMIEKEYNCFTLSERQALRAKISETERNKEYANVDYQRVGYPRPGVVKGYAPYASCLRVVDPLTMTTCFVKEFEDQETVFSLFVSQNLGAQNTCYLFLGVGTAANLQGQCQSAEIQTLTFAEDGMSMQLLYRTPCEQIPTAFCQVRGRLAVGLGNILRVFELGQK